MFDLAHGLLFVFSSTILLLIILVLVNVIANTLEKEKKELNECQKSIQKINDKGR